MPRPMVILSRDATPANGAEAARSERALGARVLAAHAPRWSSLLLDCPASGGPSVQCFVVVNHSLKPASMRRVGLLHLQREEWVTGRQEERSWLDMTILLQLA